MKRKGLYVAFVLAMACVFAGVILAQRPATNVDPGRHPNLAEAQHHIVQAFEKIEVAQKENKFDLGGHADKAKELLDQASRELKEAAEYADHHHR